MLASAATKRPTGMPPTALLLPRTVLRVALAAAVLLAAPAHAGVMPLDGEVRRTADAAIARPPQARAEVLTEGRLPGDPLLADGLAASRDWFAMLCIALSARATGEPRYTRGLQRYFEAWTGRYQPSINPVSENDFHYVALAYAVHGTALPAGLRNRSEALFRRMAEAYLDQARDRGPADRGNWQSHRVKLATALAVALRDRSLRERSHRLFRDQVDRAITAEGVVYDFIERDALHYATWSLDGLLSAALVARWAGEDWYGHRAASGGSLDAALRWLRSYAEGERSHTEFADTAVEFDRERARRGVAGFGGTWNPAQAAPTYQLAAALAPEWRSLADRLGPAPGWIGALLSMPAPADAR